MYNHQKYFWARVWATVISQKILIDFARLCTQIYSPTFMTSKIQHQKGIDENLF